MRRDLKGIKDKLDAITECCKFCKEKDFFPCSCVECGTSKAKKAIEAERDGDES